LKNPDEIEKLFEKWSRGISPGAAVGVAVGDETVFQRGFGYSNIEHKISIDTDTKFFIGSESKQFAAFAIHLLADENTISLDADILEYIPELQFTTIGITVRHLLHHTSGIRDYIDLQLLRDRSLQDNFTHQDHLRLLTLQKTLNFVPGDKFLYSNSGYLLLTEIVTRKSGKRFDNYCQDRIFAPLGMTNTYVENNDSPTQQGLARSYVPVEDGFRAINCSFDASGAGGIISTATDLLLWSANYHYPKICSESFLSTLHKPGRLNNGEAIEYASGIVVGSTAIDEHTSGPVFEHGGSIGGYKANLLRIPEEKLTIVVLANSADLPAQQLTANIANIVLQVSTKNSKQTSAQVEKKTEIGLHDFPVEPILGRYEMHPGFYLRFFISADKLYVQASGQPEFELFRNGASTFFLKNVEASVSFEEPDGQQQVQRATWQQNGNSPKLMRVEEIIGPDAGELANYAGTYYCDEIDSLFRLVMKDDRLCIDTYSDSVPLEPTAENTFSIPPFVESVVFHRNDAEELTSCSISTSRAQHLSFIRLNLPETL